VSWGRSARRPSARASGQSHRRRTRRHEICYHVFPPRRDGYANRVLQAWGESTATTATPTSSRRPAGSVNTSRRQRTGRPPDYGQNARTSCCWSSHLENRPLLINPPRRAAIVEGQAERRRRYRHRSAGFSKTSPKQGHLDAGAYSGTEGALLLAMVRVLLEEDLYAASSSGEVGWKLADVPAKPGRPDSAATFEGSFARLKELVQGRVHSRVRRKRKRAGRSPRRRFVKRGRRPSIRARQPLSTHKLAVRPPRENLWAGRSPPACISSWC